MTDPKNASRNKASRNKASRPTSALDSDGDGGIFAADVQEAQSLLRAVAGMATEAAERYATVRKDRLVDTVVDIAATIRRSGRQFEGQQDWLADAIDRGASAVRDKAENLRDARVPDLLAQGRSLARERPGVFAICALLAGVAAAGLIQQTLGDLRKPRSAAAA